MVSIVGVGGLRSGQKRSSAFALVLGLLFSLFGSAAQATVTYSFNADSAFLSGIGSFTYTAPDFITTNISVAPADLDACTVLGGTCGTMQFFADSTGFTGATDQNDVIGFAGVFGDITATGFYYFDNGTFSNVGNFATVLLGADQAGRLTITSNVPEPAPLALMSLALVALFIVRRRRPAA